MNNQEPDVRDKAFLQGLGELLGSSSGIAPEAELNDANWDSVVMISAIALIDQTYGITVPTGALRNCGSVVDLLNAVHAAAQNGGVSSA